MKLGHENWIQIPCAPKYEINQRGQVRNIKTGHILKPYIRKGRVEDIRICLRIEKDNSTRHFSQAGLLWLTHGEIPKRKTYSRIAVPVIISRGGERHYFDSCNQAAAFIAKREHYSVITVGIHLSKRREEIYGWRINYQR